jgi:Ser/Thr protein kinase RdoA (MazF antagonist)
MSVGRIVASHYDLQEPLRCKFYVLGLHDNYLIENKTRKFILRIYRNAWRSPEEISLELELLTFLGDKNAPVASPVRTKRGELAFRIESPEGERLATLFYYADGHAPENSISYADSALLGRSVAYIHSTTETFSTTSTRPVLDIPYLLDESISAIEPFVDSEGCAYLKALQDKLHNVLPGLPRETGVYGICIGDVNPTNFHIDRKKQITLFDFDQCGYGYRAFEIGKFISSVHSHKTKHDIAKAFIDGYQQVRQLSQAELDVIPYFEIVSVIWVMAIHVYNADRIGYKRLEKPFWDRRLANLKELDIVESNINKIQSTQKTRC